MAIQQGNDLMFTLRSRSAVLILSEVQQSRFEGKSVAIRGIHVSMCSAIVVHGFTPRTDRDLDYLPQITI